MKPLARGLLGGYCLLFIVALLYLIITILPSAGEGEVAPLSLGPEAGLILLVALVGALGACIHMATSFALFAGKSELAASWLWWYLLRPFIGAVLATILYLVVRGLLFSTAAGARTANLFGVLAFAGLAGMFSKQAIEWLRRVFDQMFHRLSDVERHGPDEE
ncbi:MAG: hypothetical protein NUW06_03615 [Candidatus Acetothermia bacterium]|jgi:hypothetical protein|nr:hypothetical protein [Candidatus Acetothermia bacterium]MDH7505050.1 hypothetical protein [Candidatus Acetothermia bacterium]